MEPNELPDSLREKFESLHETLVDNLIQRLSRDECTHQELAVAAKFLKDNKIEVAPGNGGIKSLTDLVQDCPFQDTDHDDLPETGT